LTEATHVSGAVIVRSTTLEFAGSDELVCPTNARHVAAQSGRFFSPTFYVLSFDASRYIRTVSVRAAVPSQVLPLFRAGLVG